MNRFVRVSRVSSAVIAGVVAVEIWGSTVE